MIGKRELKSKKRGRRHKRVRAKVFGLPERPRLSVFKSNQYLYIQIIDDEKGKTLLSADTRSDKKSSLSQARLLGKKIGQSALKEGIKKVVFDRGGFLYAGKIKEIAEGAREAGLEF